MNSVKPTTPVELLNLYLSDGKSAGPAGSKLYQKFNRELTWDALLNEGCQQDIAPMLYYIITKRPTLPKGGERALRKIYVGEEIESKLKGLYHHYLRQSMVQFHELDKILNTFEREGNDVIQLKGAWLAKNYYPDPALRPMGDLDLLVRKEYMKKAKKSLMNQGYVFNGTFPFINEDSYEKAHFHFPYRKSNSLSPIFVELHHDIAVKSDFINNNILEFWENALQINGKHNHILKIPNEYLLLHIFWHTFHNLSEHLYIRLIWLIDILCIIVKHCNNLDWIFIEKKANELRIQKQVYFCLYLIVQLFDINFDNKIIRTLMPTNSSQKIFNYIMLKMENDTLSLNDPNRFLIILLNLLSLNTFHERITYLFRYNYYKNPLNKKDWIKRKYRITSKKSIYLFLILNPVISILKVFKGLCEIILASNKTSYKGRI
jgi:hypothetical protein